MNPTEDPFDQFFKITLATRFTFFDKEAAGKEKIVILDKQKEG